MLTLKAAIVYVETVARANESLVSNYESDKRRSEIHRQLAAYLRELQERRKAPEIIYCHECIHFQCNMRFDGYVSKGADAYECRRGCGGCDPMDYCSYGERAERRTDADD